MRRPLIVWLACLLVACSEDEPASPPSAVVSIRADNLCGKLFEVQLRLGSRIRGATPDALGFGDYLLQPDGTFTSPGASCNDEIAQRLTALCEPCNQRPEDCEPEVRALFRQVPAACSRCGDEVCYGGESVQSCAPDCAASCGDGVCSPLELAATCPVDCAAACGDGMCSSGEDATNCPADCRFSAGDGVCQPGETPENSPQDCGFSTCGDGFCQSYETALRCQEDCCWPRVCSEGYRRCRDSHTIEVCELSGEGSCPEVVTGEVCDNGCVDDPLGASTHCRTCAEVLADTFSDFRSACDPSAAHRCAGTNRVFCQALAATPSCGYEVTEACSGACSDGNCVSCAADCALSNTRCSADGRTLEGCRLVAPGCQQWTPVESCTQGCTGEANRQHCATCLDTGCDAGLTCLGGQTCAECAPGSCQEGVRRCSGQAVEACLGGVVNSVSCTGWVLEQLCTGACLTEGETFAYCGT